MARQSVRGQVANQDAENTELAAVQQRVRDARNWFTKVVPSHVDAEQFIALGLGQLSKDPELQKAAVRNPGSFMLALSHCARLGLIPGETYHLVAYSNKNTGVATITGIVDYKGEIDMIYRAGGVDAVYCHVIRAADDFAWRPGMEIPLHTIGANEHGQEGLADDDERGPRTGVYAYARLADGGWSTPVVMPRSEVMKHKAVAKTPKFWDGVWEDDMWKKTAIHKLFDWVPHSTEYLRDRMRAQAAELPPGVTQADVEDAGDLPALPPVPGAVENGSPAGVTPGELSKIGRHLTHFQCTDPPDQLHVVSVIAGRQLGGPEDLSAPEAGEVLAWLEDVRKRISGDGAPAMFRDTIARMEASSEPD